MDHVMYVKLVKKRVAILGDVSSERVRGEMVRAYLGHGRSKNNNLVQLAHPLHERIHPRPFDDIDIMVLAFDLDGYGEIGLVENLHKVSGWPGMEVEQGVP